MGNVEEEERHCLLLKRMNPFNEMKKMNVVYDSKTISSPINKILTTTNDDNVKVCQDKNCQACNISLNNDVSQQNAPIKKNKFEKHTASENATHRFFSQIYGPFLLNNGVRALVILSYMIYLIAALYGCTQFREGLEPSHLVTDDHYIAKYFRDIKLFWQRGPQLHVAILNPPKLTDPVQR